MADRRFFEIFKEIYFGKQQTLEALLTEEERRKLLNERAAKATLIIEEHYGPGEACKYEEMRRNEKLHRVLVRSVMNELMFARHAKDPTTAIIPSVHDWSKDEAYIFCTLMHFRYNIKDLVSQYTQPEIDRHLRTEKHHPEFEFQDHITEPALTDDDILETGIDRLSRCLQFNRGNLKFDQILKFKPVFRNFADPGEPDTARLGRYMKHVTDEDNISLVKRHYDLIFG